MVRLPPGPLFVPRGLRQGDTIAFLSPSGQLNELLPGPISRAASKLESLGFQTKVFWTSPPPNITIAQSIAQRVAELRAAFADESVSAIICTIGGSTAIELLSVLAHDREFESLIDNHAKIFIGYSDVTVLHYFLTAHSLRTFYGPTVIPELGATDADSALDFCIKEMLRVVAPTHPMILSATESASGDSAIGAISRSTHYATTVPDFLLPRASKERIPRVLQPSPAWKWLRSGPPATGFLFGGCLPTVVRLQGVACIAPAAAEWAGRIMFLETSFAEGGLDRGYKLGDIRKGLADLAAQGVFHHIEGLVFGRFFGYDTAEARQELEQVLQGVLCPEMDDDPSTGLDLLPGIRDRKRFPILMNVDFGHTTPMVTLPIGAHAKLDSAKDEFTILERGVT